jgi:hypothetical protein
VEIISQCLLLICEHYCELEKNQNNVNAPLHTFLP